MTVTVQDIADYVNTLSTDDMLPRLLLQANTLVSGYLRPTGVVRCPEEIYDWAVVQVASQLWQRHNSPDGVSQWGPDGTAAFLPADPLNPVRAVLKQYRGIGAVG